MFSALWQLASLCDTARHQEICHQIITAFSITTACLPLQSSFSESVVSITLKKLEVNLCPLQNLKPTPQGDFSFQEEERIWIVTAMNIPQSLCNFSKIKFIHVMSIPFQCFPDRTIRFFQWRQLVYIPLWVKWKLVNENVITANAFNSLRTTGSSMYNIHLPVASLPVHCSYC